MANQYNNKVVLGNDVLIDLTADTVTPASLLQGYTAHDASGASITGTASTGSTHGGDVYQDGDGFVVLDDGPYEEPTITALTVTPTTSQQVFNGVEYSDTVYTQNIVETTRTWSLAPVAGSSYHVVIQRCNDNDYVIGDPIDCGVWVASSDETELSYGHIYVSTSRIRNTWSSKYLVKLYEIVSIDGYLPVTVNAIPSEYIVPSGTLNITENGTHNVGQYASAIVNVSSGGGGSTTSMSDPIRFFDYDGTLVASYTSVPLSLPAVPTHSKLTNGTWNYTLAQIETQFNAMGTCNVGANYDTVSGATEIDIVLHEGRLHPYLSLAVDGTISIDWGDNSIDTATGTSLVARLSTIHHEYAAAGSYTIKITKTNGTGYSLNCTSVNMLLHKNSSTTYANRVYSNCVQAIRVGEDCTIGSYAFYCCYSLASISIPSSVTSIGNYAFYTCYSLASISIPSGVTSIGTYMFNGCSSLAFVSIPSGVTSIGMYAFYYCYSLTSISMPSGVTSISDYAFYNCYSLASVSIPTSITSISNYAFGSCYSLASVSMPSGVTSIGNYAFSSCSSLASISIPSGVTSIGTYAFSSCSSLASISIPSGVTSIGSYMFGSCHSLASISIPSGVTSINSYAFVSCYGMKEYHFLATTPPTLANTNAFTSIQSDCVIYVPAESLEAYQTAENWSTYASYMVGE